MNFVPEKYNSFQKLTGLDPYGGFETVIVPLIHSIMTFKQWVLSFIFVILNIHTDSFRALTTLPLIFGLASVLTVYWYLLFHRKRVHSLLDELRGVVSLSMPNFYYYEYNGH